MQKSDSTLDFPVKFFVDFFINGGYPKYKENFLSWCQNEAAKDSNVKMFRSQHDLWVNQNIANSVGEDSYQTTFMSQDLNTFIRSEVEKSKKLLLNEQATKYTDRDKLFTSQKVTLKQILKENESLFKEFTSIRESIEELVSYIDELSELESYQPDNLINTSFPQEQKEEVDIVEEVTGYLKGQNEYGQTIMSSEEYNRMLKFLRKVIEDKKVQTPEIPFDFGGRLTVGVLRFTFHVLHLKLYGKEKKDYFLKSVHKAIKQFERWKYESFKTKISVPPTKFPECDVPEIIRKQAGK
ncbi:hypothetical protein [Maribellus sp. YY47]|uniref:hypothetical protein n=1 Tax=Maribellus sp. YY47 TaxID=2929486 RepID=UPI0020017C99|nr:hypothetical protein [Maribellus sp. YY47]MCK3683968.1 hypothetical protein [Maribellus sp. YY47]